MAFSCHLINSVVWEMIFAGMHSHALGGVYFLKIVTKHFFFFLKNPVSTNVTLHENGSNIL